PIAPCPLTNLNADDGRIVAGLSVMPINAGLAGAGGWTIRRFAPQWQEKHDAKRRGGTNAGTDAGMAAALPQAHRQCRAAAWRARDRVALDRGADRAHQLRGHPSPRPEGRPTAGTRRLSPGRPHRHTRVEHG